MTPEQSMHLSPFHPMRLADCAAYPLTHTSYDLHIHDALVFMHLGNSLGKAAIDATCACREHVTITRWGGVTSGYPLHC